MSKIGKWGGGGKEGNLSLVEVGVPQGFSSEWFDKTDADKLEQFVSKTQSDTLAAWQKQFADNDKVPSPEELQTAGKQVGNSLQTAFTRDEFYALLNGNESVSISESQSLTSHLTQLLPKFELPQPIPKLSEISSSNLWIIWIIGGVVGGLLGAWLGTLTGISRETAELTGFSLGAFFAIISSIDIANNQELRKYFLYSIGIAAAGDSFLQIIKKATRPSALSLFWKDRRIGYFKRMSIYIGITVILLLLERSATYDKVRFRSDTETAIENYIRSVLPLAVVLLFKLKSSAKITAEVEKEEKQNSDLVLSLLPIINRSRLRESDDVDELIQELQHYGYEIKEQPTSNEVLIWAAELEERYKPFGYIEDGTPVEVERDPIIQNGEVKEKGRVRKKRSVS